MEKSYSPQLAAMKFLEKYFPHAKNALLAGSVVENEQTRNSDLDIIVIVDDHVTYSKKCVFDFDWPIEAFVYQREIFYTMFETECMVGRASLPRMCASGVILMDDGFSSEVKEQAQKRMAEGPVAWSIEQIDEARYRISDLLDDFICSRNEKEELFTAVQLSNEVHEFILRTRQQWTGYGKWMVRSLKEFDQSVCEEYVSKFESYFRNNDQESLIEYIRNVLQPYGGELFDGFEH